MQVKRTNTSQTEVKLLITADAGLMQSTKEKVLKKLRPEVKLPGFRGGKAPLSLIEKNIDHSTLQTEFLDEAVNALYVQAVTDEKLRPVNRPDVAIKKFVPFTDLEFEATVEVVGKVKLFDYKKIKKTKPSINITDKDIADVIENLRTRAAEKKDVDRAAKDGDQVVIDFAGKDDKGESVQGADGKEYPLVLGSNTLIPGFEPELIGMKAGEEKTFDITFPKDYGVAALQSKKVTFTVKATKVQEVIEPTVDDAFAASLGPFTTVEQLIEDIRKQLTQERQSQSDRDYEDELVREITAKSKVEIPPVLIEEQLDYLEQQERQNLMYKGETWEEHLKSEGIDEKSHREKKRVEAEERVKAGLVLSEIAEQEMIEVRDDEVDVRIQLHKGQYQDAAMQAELDKPETRREIRSRLMAEKTVDRLVSYATAK